ncbi:GGDEF domain-containing protein [Cryptosporangium japonicum]|uniref:GGDEF domain-containing protein n=1 Tax=Cryptosporangium japonicum TaxID=80872 RepID=UPI0031E02379
MRRSAFFRAACTDRGLLALVGGLLLASSWLIFGNTPEPHRTTLFWAVQAPGDLMFFLSALAVTRNVRDDRRAYRFWRLLTFAGGVFVTADVLRTAEGVVGLETTESGPVQLACLAIGQTAIFAALIGYPMLIGSGAARQRFLLDASIVLAGVGAMVWFLLADPRAANTTGGGVIGGLVIGVGVLAVGFFAVKLVLSGHSPVGLPAAATMIASAIVLVGQIVVLPIYAGPLDPGVALAAQLLPTALIAAGPRLELLRFRVDPEHFRLRTRRRPYSVLPYGVVGGVQLLLFGAFVIDDELTLRCWGMLIAMCLVTGLVVVRQLLSFGENSRLIGELDHANLQLRHQADHDVLTQLANRRLFTERLDASAGAGEDSVALLAIDLDGFKPINDRYGHHVGDAVLIAVAERIRRCVRPTDTAARLGGDEFAVLMPGATPESAGQLVARLERVLSEPIGIGELRLSIGASIGVTVGSAEDPETLLRAADAAMYAVKHHRAPKDLMQHQ